MKPASAPSPLEQAATVLLVRDAPRLEVFLLERHIESDFVGGAYVFPGGKLDASDFDIAGSSVTGDPPEALVAEFGSELATGLTVAAIRETFEESGVLLGSVDGAPADAAVLGSESFVQARRLLNDRNSAWLWHTWLQEQQVRLDLSSLEWWSWWVTPIGVHRRYDTKFFIAHLPADQAPVHDDVETTASRWVEPGAALQQAADGRVSIILPTRKNLTQLCDYPDSDAAMAGARSSHFNRPRIEPHIDFDSTGTARITHPSFSQPETM